MVVEKRRSRGGGDAETKESMTEFEGERKQRRPK